MTPYYMITVHLTTANPFHFGCSLVTQMSSVHINVQASSVERCKSNLSLAIGTSQCTNIYLTLLLPFALAGLMLVLFLIICNLTVSMGTINGLIFYANIVRANHAFFFTTPTTSALKVFQQVHAVFIAWLNLDFGIETCFINSMDAYIRTWLQFAFPFYIWMIVGVIIYLSRCSTTIVKLVGSSAVSVLATLFLLSYRKLGSIVTP